MLLIEKESTGFPGFKVAMLQRANQFLSALVCWGKGGGGGVVVVVSLWPRTERHDNEPTPILTTRLPAG